MAPSHLECVFITNSFGLEVHPLPRPVPDTNIYTKEFTWIFKFVSVPRPIFSGRQFDPVI